MVVLTNNATQVVQPGNSVVLDVSLSGCCSAGLVSNSIELSGARRYLASFGANVTGATAGAAVQLAMAIDGSPITATTMISTPATAGVFNNVSRTIGIDGNKCCCKPCDTVRLTVRNTGTLPITVANPTLTVARV